MISLMIASLERNSIVSCRCFGGLAEPKQPVFGGNFAAGLAS
jgi:hypothetical protein